MAFSIRICFHLAVIAASCVLGLPIAVAQTRVMPLGNSITQGGNGYVSYRYELWFDLQSAGYTVDSVGSRDSLYGGEPNLGWYPDYYTTFDRDHEGYWGWRTDEIANIVIDATINGMPDSVLIHLGTNDVGQMGAAGVTNADANLRLIIDRIRSVRPTVTILLAQVIPIGPGTWYYNNADQIAPLNAVIATIAADMDTPMSPVILVDQHTGFDVGTMMQSDGLHPNLVGEARMADVWHAALAPLLSPENPPPSVAITMPADGETFTAPADITVMADAADSNGFVTHVNFYNGPALLGTDTTSPYSIEWTDVPVGNYALSAVATDDEDATQTSDPVWITVVPSENGVPVAIYNPSFEEPVLTDGALAEGPGPVGGWLFSGTANTYVGIFNPPTGSYPSAGGSGTPDGADGANAAYLFNNGGPAESVSATQTLTEDLAADMEYTLIVAIGKFLPDQPYDFSTYGGYVIELLARGTVVASDSDSMQPGFGEFHDALATVSSSAVDPSLIGQPISIVLTISATEEDRSTHFDHVRLLRRSLVPGDMDHDGDTDLDDYAVFAACIAGADVSTPPGACTPGHFEQADLEQDDDVDLADFAPFQEAFTGSLP
jgi:lysophospholipase L1-like esterase